MIAIDEGKWEEFVTDNDLLTIKKKEDRKKAHGSSWSCFGRRFFLVPADQMCIGLVEGIPVTETYSRRYKYIV